MNDYARIARIIKWMDDSHVEQPSLQDLADHLGLSMYHFHRLFSEWAGVTPKAFLRCLTHAHAKHLLTGGTSVLDTTLDLGLSSPSRLHDLCVDLEAATPGEVRSGGRGWTITYGFGESPFGRVIVGENDRGICHLTFADELSDESAVDLIQDDWPNANLVRDDQRACDLVDLVFSCPRSSLGKLGKQRAIKAFVKGTAMQIKVWRALIQIPSGQLTSYGDLAACIGQPGAARATGSAVGSNPIAYLIPCHRVIRKTGALSGYRWGVERKRVMIARETASLWHD